MTPGKNDRMTIEQPLARLERQLIRAYIAGAGQDLHVLMATDR
jgi:hypothetical protein